jgi:rare lipoprotein A
VKDVIWILAIVTFAIILASAVPVVGAPARGETMVASYYGSESGNRTANGEHFRPNGLTAAHRTLPFGTRLRVCYRGCVVVRVNDRGPFIRGRQLDLSKGAARAIGLTAVGVGRLQVERIRVR